MAGETVDATVPPNTNQIPAIDTGTIDSAAAAPLADPDTTTEVVQSVVDRIRARAAAGVTATGDRYDAFGDALNEIVNGATPPAPVEATIPVVTPVDESGSGGTTGSAESAPTTAPTTPPTAPDSDPVVATIDGIAYRQSEFATLLETYSIVQSQKPMIDALNSGRFDIVPKGQGQSPQISQEALANFKAPEPVDPRIARMNDLISQLGEDDPRMAEAITILRDTTQRDLDNLKSVAQQSAAQSTASRAQAHESGANTAIEQFSQYYNLTPAQINLIIDKAAETQYLPMMMNKRYQSGNTNDQTVAYESTIELLDMVRATQFPQLTPATTQGATSVAAPSPVTPTTPPPPSASDPAEIERRIQQEVAVRLNTALAGGGSGSTGSLAQRFPAPIDTSKMSPEERRDYHNAELTKGIIELQKSANGQG